MAQITRWEYKDVAGKERKKGGLDVMARGHSQSGHPRYQHRTNSHQHVPCLDPPLSSARRALTDVHCELSRLPGSPCPSGSPIVPLSASARLVASSHP